MASLHPIALLVFAPLLGAVICWLVGRRVRSEAFIGTVACTAIGISTVIAFILAFRPETGALHSTAPILDHLWTWIEVGRFRADFGFAMDRLSGLYALFVTFVGLLIHVFATGYMHGDKSFYRFFAYLNLFMFSMLTLILADNLLLMFVGWEGVGLCSYLLIGYYIDRQEAGNAAKKAFIANRVGDWGVILGIMAVFFLTGSISFFDKPTEITGSPALPSAMNLISAMPVDSFTAGALVAGGITSAALLLFIGATGKSAQIPLFVWLPDAMAGPTPVSALIHAATMVTAGVYMIVRCSAIYTHAPTTMFIIAIVGALTALLAATIGLAQNDIKKVLAYSTVSQLGYMMLACGVGAFAAAIFHVMTHAFFKALLFLGSGSVIHGMHHEQDMRRMGGLRKFMPITFATMLTGWLAISGIPIFAGFFSKDEILWRTWSTEANPFGGVLWVVGAVTAGITAVYMTRMMVMTFWGEERFREVPAGGQADEAHAQAYDDGSTSHAAHTASAGDRPQHQPGSVTTSGSDDHHRDDDEDQHAATHGHGGVHTPHESPLVMTVPLVILAILSTLGGLLGVPYALSSIVGLGDVNYIEHVLEPVIAHAGASTHGVGETHGESSGNAAESGEGSSHRFSAGYGETADQTAPGTIRSGEHAVSEQSHSPEEVRNERIFTVISIAIAVIGIFIGWSTFQKRPLLRFPGLLENKYYVDEAYDATLINPIKVGSREGLWRLFDVGVIDGIVNGVGKLFAELGSSARQAQTGYVRSYAAFILLGSLFVIGYFAFKSLPVLVP